MRGLGIIYFFIEIYFLLKTIKCIDSCPDINNPILYNSNCQLIYCTKIQFDNGDCVIGNEIAKQQWLNNIIPIGDLNFRYINFASNSNGDMIVETTSFPPGTNERKFFGLKKNGSFYFKEDNNNPFYFYLVII